MSVPREPVRPGTVEVDLDRSIAGVGLLVVRGEIDTLTAPALGAGLDQLLAVPEVVVAVDLADVGFLASSGLAVLIGAAHRAGTQGRELHLVTRSRAVTRPLEVTGSDRLFTLHEDVATLPAPPPRAVD